MILYKRFIMLKILCSVKLFYVFVKLYTEATIENLICTDATFNICWKTVTYT